jgi:Zn-finger nucleic acid-binding protein|tara:strand:+ start:2952 stop:3383 length:432 start_codon:yes stop_codon:yes gene_type:complete
MKRDCPRCFSELKPEKLSKGLWKVEIDKCESCSGIYLDKGELMTLTGNRPLHHLTTKHLGIDSGSELLCPSCGSIMDDEHPDGVEIDVCLQCNGVWLDKKELDLLKKIDPSTLKTLSPEKLAEMYDADQSIPSSGLFSWLFGR